MGENIKKIVTRVNEKPGPIISLLLWGILLSPIILHFVFPIQIILVFPFTLIGIVPVIIGLVINLQATRILKNVFEKGSKNPKVLVTEGAFQYSRNPLYLGAIVFGFGLSILLGSLVAFGLPAIMFLFANFLYVPYEEDQLKTMFGKEYLDYMNRVRKWI